MPAMTIRVINSTFESSNAGEFATLDDAFRAAVSAGVEIAANEVTGGVSSTIVEVVVDLVGQKGAARGAVSVSAARFVDPQST